MSEKKKQEYTTGGLKNRQDVGTWNPLCSRYLGVLQSGCWYPHSHRQE